MSEVTDLVAEYRRHWREDAACEGMDTDIFFPLVGQGNRLARQVCMSCDVQEECLEWALETNQKFGIWGGASERERRRIRRRRMDLARVERKMLNIA